MAAASAVSSQGPCSPAPANMPKLTPRFQTRTRLKKEVTATGLVGLQPLQRRPFGDLVQGQDGSASSRPARCRLAHARVLRPRAP